MFEGGMMPKYRVECDNCFKTWERKNPIRDSIHCRFCGRKLGEERAKEIADEIAPTPDKAPTEIKKYIFPW